MHQELPAQQRTEKNATSLWQTAPVWRRFLIGAAITTIAGISAGLWSQEAPPTSVNSTKIAEAAAHMPPPSLPATLAIPDPSTSNEKVTPPSSSKSNPAAQTAPQVQLPKKEKVQRPVLEKKPELALAQLSPTQTPAPTPTPPPAPAVLTPPIPVPFEKIIPPLASIAEPSKSCNLGLFKISPVRKPPSNGKVVSIISAQTSRALIESSMASANGDQDAKYLNDLLANVQSLDGKNTRVIHIHGVNVVVGDHIVFDWSYADPAVPCRYVPSIIKGVLPPLPPVNEAVSQPTQ